MTNFILRLPTIECDPDSLGRQFTFGTFRAKSDYARPQKGFQWMTYMARENEWKTATHVIGTICYPCLRVRPGADRRARLDSNQRPLPFRNNSGLSRLLPSTLRHSRQCHVSGRLHCRCGPLGHHRNLYWLSRDKILHYILDNLIRG